MTESGQNVTAAAPSGARSTALQRAHLERYRQLRDELAQGRAAAEAALGTPQEQSAVERLIAVADRFCDRAAEMPALMDAEARDRSRRVLRITGLLQLVAAGVTAGLVRSGALGWGWLVAAVAFLVSAGLLAVCPVGPPGAPQHRQQRRPGSLVPVLSAAGIAVAVTTTWWWLAAVCVLSGIGATVLATLVDVDLSGADGGPGRRQP